MTDTVIHVILMLYIYKRILLTCFSFTGHSTVLMALLIATCCNITQLN